MDERATYREVFAVGEFRALFASYLLSLVGDQVAKVALTVLVFMRTGSATLTALTYALTFLPALVAGPLLSGLADRYPRRQVMISADVARAALIALMAIPGVPLVILCALLVAVQMLAAPYDAARAATLRVILSGDRYVVGSSVSNISYQVAQVVGFAAGGFLVAGTNPSAALVIDAMTFVVSAAVLRTWVRSRPAPAIIEPPRDGAAATVDGSRRDEGWQGRLGNAAMLLWRDRRLRMLTALMAVTAFVVPIEGLAVPYADELGLGAAAVGLLLAADPAGSAVGMMVLNRLQPSVRLRLIRPLAVLSPAVLCVCFFEPGLELTIAVWAASGAFSGYFAVVNAELVRALPDGRTGQAFGLINTTLRAAQGVAVLLAGIAADYLPAAMVIGVAGALGAVAALAAASSWLAAQAAAQRT